MPGYSVSTMGCQPSALPARSRQWYRSGMADSDPSFFDEIDEAAEIAPDAEGLAQLDAGKGVPHAEVSAWMETWGTPDERPAPASWFK